MPFKDRDAIFETTFYVEDIGSVKESTDRIRWILDATYEKADLKQITAECKHLKLTNASRFSRYSQNTNPCLMEP